jgi:hypothetical protein
VSGFTVLVQTVVGRAPTAAVPAHSLDDHHPAGTVATPMADVTRRRFSYSALSRLPVFGLYDWRGKLVATIRAADPYEARDLFRAHGLEGERVRRLTSGT